MSHPKASKDSGRSLPTALNFDAEPYLPGIALIRVMYGHEELATSLISEKTWFDPIKRIEWMEELGCYLYRTIIKPREGNYYEI